MDPNQPRNPNSAFEYFLYAAMLAETGLAAIVYKEIFGSGELSHLRVYFAIFYFAFLAWAIAQLNKLHRNRNQTPAPVEQSEQPARSEVSREYTRPAFGLTAAQLAIVVVVFATAIATFSWALRLLG